MNGYVTEAHARTIIEDRVRDAASRRLARECRRPEVPSGDRRHVRRPRHHSPLWAVVHWGRVYN